MRFNIVFLVEELLYGVRYNSFLFFSMRGVRFVTELMRLLVSARAWCVRAMRDSDLRVILLPSFTIGEVGVSPRKWLLTLVEKRVKGPIKGLLFIYCL